MTKGVCIDVSGERLFRSHLSQIWRLMENYPHIDLKNTGPVTIRSLLDESLYGKEYGQRQQLIVELALQNVYKWKNGQVITVRFLSDPLGIADEVLGYASEWTQYANIQFHASKRLGSDIRIAFDSPGSWSEIGTDCRSVANYGATMNFGDFTANSSTAAIRRTVLHEFGHALGCIHEHQSPSTGILWDTVAVDNYYGSPPLGW